MVDELDHKTYILEPETPTRASNTRRIFISTLLLCNHSSLTSFCLLASNVSIYLVIDPIHPNCFPECRFLGQDSGMFQCALLRILRTVFTCKIIYKTQSIL